MIRYKWLVYAVATLIFVVVAYNVGHYVGQAKGVKIAGEGEIPAISKLMQELKPGDMIVIDQKDIQTGSHEKTEPGMPARIEVAEKEDFSRVASFFGLGANEAAAKSQGIKADPQGNITVGTHQGYGLLEQGWEKIKSLFWSVFWIALIGIAGLLVLLMIPATAPFAAGALRAIAGVFPIIGSIVENILGKLKWKKPLEQVVAGGEEFKTALNTVPIRDTIMKDIDVKKPADLLLQADKAALEIKDLIMHAFKISHDAEQDKITQNVVETLK